MPPVDLSGQGHENTTESWTTICVRRSQLAENYSYGTYADFDYMGTVTFDVTLCNGHDLDLEIWPCVTVMIYHFGINNDFVKYYLLAMVMVNIRSGHDFDRQTEGQIDFSIPLGYSEISWPFKQEAQRATYRAPEYNVPPFWGISQGGHFCFLIGPKNTNLVEDIEILLPVKFHWIPLSGFRG